MNLDILALSFIQGISEILPISSSVNLYLFSQLFNWTNFTFSLKVALHAGSLLTLIVYFWKDIMDILKALTGKKPVRKTYLIPLILGTIPVVIFGFLSRDFIKEFDSAKIMGLSCIVFGLALVIFDKLASNHNRRYSTVSPFKAFLIGCGETIALFPGVSRLGICLTTSRILGLDRKQAINFSLMLAIPSICGSLFLEILDAIKTPGTVKFSNDALLGIIITAIIGLIVIRPCVRYMEKIGFVYLAAYRVAIGSIIYFM